MKTTNRKPTEAELRAAYETARLAELRIVDALPEKATKSQFDRAWAAAERTNVAMRALHALLDG